MIGQKYISYPIVFPTQIIPAHWHPLHKQYWKPVPFDWYSALSSGDKGT